MQLQLADWFGIAAAAASLYAALAKTMIPLRWAAIAASALAIVYGVLLAAYAVAALGAILLVVHAWRLHAMRRLIGEVAAALEGDMSADWLLPYARPKDFRAGDVIMARGDYATAAFYVVAGEVEIAELDQNFGAGTLLGEIGLFTPDGRRTKTVRCKTDVRTAVLDYDRFKELYFQNPQFGFRLLELIVARLQASPSFAESPATA